MICADMVGDKIRVTKGHHLTTTPPTTTSSQTTGQTSDIIPESTTNTSPWVTSETLADITLSQQHNMTASDTNVTNGMP